MIYSAIVVNTQKFQSHISLSDKGKTFIPKHSLESLTNFTVSSILKCSKQCNENIFCRTLIYDQTTSSCQLYQSDSTSAGTVISSTSPTSRVGTIQYQQSFYINYNKTCTSCEYNRYLTCQNSRCQCPSPNTYWNGFVCENKLFYSDTCNSSIQCRADLNLSCIFQSCQLNTAICKLGATPIIFDDVPNKDPHQGIIPSVYAGLNWINTNYLNASAFIGSGYDFVHSSGVYVAWFDNPVTIQTLTSNQTITLNSFICAAGWSNSLFLTIDGYYFSSQLYTRTVSLNTYTQTLIIFNWTNINKIVLTPSGSGYYDTGIDNLCITF